MRSLRGIKRASEDDFNGICHDDIAEKVNSVARLGFKRRATAVPNSIHKLQMH